jgi:hypothetical protein
VLATFVFATLMMFSTFVFAAFAAFTTFMIIVTTTLRNV